MKAYHALLRDGWHKPCAEGYRETQLFKHRQREGTAISVPNGY